MAEVITAPNYSDINLGEATQLTADAAQGSNIFNVKNVQGFLSDDFFVLGEGEKAEILAIFSIVGQQITTKTTSKFLHKQYEKLQELVGDQIKFYRASAGTDNTPPADTAYTLLPAGTVSMYADQAFTPYNDASGGVNYWYKFTYYNSYTNGETLLSDATAIRGGDYGHYVSIPSIRKEAGFANTPSVTDDWISEIREEAENEVNSFLLQAGIVLPITNPPPMLRLLTKKLAAGNLEVQSYGAGTQNATTTDGYNKINWAESFLTKIATGKQSLAGADYLSVEDTSGGVGAVAGFPNDDYSNLNPALDGWTGDIDVLQPLGGEPPMFTVDNDPV